MALVVYLVALLLGIAAFTINATTLGILAGILMCVVAFRAELLWLMRTLKPYRAPRVTEV